MDSATADRLQELGLELPEQPPSQARYASSTIYRGLAFFSGKIAQRDGAVPKPGQLGAELSLVEGIAAARDAALNLLAAMEADIGLENVVQVLKLTGFVASADGFVDQPAVIDAASTLFIDVLGDRGRHARSAIGVACLPRNTPVEVEAIVAIADSNSR